jgi:misacylated tRNA(Ala) deacylase
MENRKNYDPRMHTAEHILNGTMVQMFNTKRAFSAHLEKKKSKCDYKINRNLNEDEISSLENKVNQVIQMHLDISEEFILKEEAEPLFNLERLPEDAGETVRVIRVGTYDACPCSGPHVSNTKEIGSFRIISHDFNEGVLRIRFKLDAPGDNPVH